jgi:hypothetical protein
MAMPSRYHQRFFGITSSRYRVRMPATVSRSNFLLVTGRPVRSASVSINLPQDHASAFVRNERVVLGSPLRRT